MPNTQIALGAYIITEWDPKTGKFIGVSGLRGMALPK